MATKTISVDLEAYARLAAATGSLRNRNQLIGTNDLWIAAAALAHGMPLVTNCGARFGRIANRAVVAY